MKRAEAEGGRGREAVVAGSCPWEPPPRMLRSVDMIPPESGPAAAEEVDLEEEEEVREGTTRRAAGLEEERIPIEEEKLLLVLIFPLCLGATIEQRDAEETQARIE